MKILIVDESVFLREKLIKSLYEIDNTFLIREEATFDGGVSAFGSFNPDLVILELDLLHESGITLLKKIKATPVAATVIIFTNYSGEELQARCIEAGADFFCDKCKEYWQIIEIVKKLATEKQTSITIRIPHKK